MLRVEHLMTSGFPSSPRNRRQMKKWKGVNDKKIKSFGAHLLTTYCLQGHSCIESGQGSLLGPCSGRPCGCKNLSASGSLPAGAACLSL